MSAWTKVSGYLTVTPRDAKRTPKLTDILGRIPRDSEGPLVCTGKNFGWQYLVCFGGGLRDFDETSHRFILDWMLDLAKRNDIASGAVVIEYNDSKKIFVFDDKKNKWLQLS